jgi:hypothetical protein
MERHRGIPQAGLADANPTYNTTTDGLTLVACPTCAQPAEVQWRRAVSSTDGDVAIVKIVCIDRHWYLMPSEGLDRL